MRRWSNSSCERDRRRDKERLQHGSRKVAVLQIRIGEADAAGDGGARLSKSLPGGHSEREPPDPIPNSEVKTPCADGSVPFRHARVGHCQASNTKAPTSRDVGGLFSSRTS